MPTSDPSSYAALHAFAAFGAFLWLFILACIVFAVVMYWRIASKAGYSGALSLLMIVPLANLLLLIFFAFSEWPIEQELKRLRGGPAPGTSVTPAL